MVARRHRLIAWGIFCALLTLAFCAAVIEAARAHGDADWINRGGYRNSSGEHCCGKEDCHVVLRVQRVPGGYHFPEHGLSVPDRDTMESRDGKAWICLAPAWGLPMGAMRVRCAFLPGTGS